MPAVLTDDGQGKSVFALHLIEVSFNVNRSEEGVLKLSIRKQINILQLRTINAI